MAFSYLSPDFPFLRQGEIIENLFELRPKISPGTTVDVEQAPDLDRIDHPYAITISQDCDLLWDYKARQGQTPSDKLLSHVLFCDLFLEDEVRDRSSLKSSNILKRVRGNQVERYHCLDQGPVGETGQTLLELYADFKATFSLPVEFVYWLTSSGQAARRGFLPSPYLEDFMHRLYSFLGRVATPGAEDNTLGS